MKPITLWRKKVTQLPDGRRCTPYFVYWRLYSLRKVVKGCTNMQYKAPKRKLITTNAWIIRRMFRLYLWLTRFGYSHSTVNRVYDNLGDIDTLGSSDDYTKFTYSHSCELYSMFAIKLGKYRALEYINGEEKELYYVRRYDNSELNQD